MDTLIFHEYSPMIPSEVCNRLWQMLHFFSLCWQLKICHPGFDLSRDVRIMAAKVMETIMEVEEMPDLEECKKAEDPGAGIECEGWRRHSCLIFLILLFTKPNIEVSGWLYQNKTHFTHIVYQPFSRVSPPSFTLYVKISLI